MATRPTRPSWRATEEPETSIGGAAAEDRAAPAIRGDVQALAEVAVHAGSGSLTATLRKPLREALGTVGERLAGAALRFEAGPGVVLLGAPGEAALRVQRLGPNRFEITLDTGADVEVDEATAAFLALKLDQLRAGRLDLTPPMTPAELRAATAAKRAAAEARAAERAEAPARPRRRKLAARRAVPG